MFQGISLKGKDSLKNIAIMPLKESKSVSHSVVSDSATPWNCSLPGSSLHGIFQARILEWVAVPFSMGSS